MSSLGGLSFCCFVMSRLEVFILFICKKVLLSEVKRLKIIIYEFERPLLDLFHLICTNLIIEVPCDRTIIKV